MVWNVTCLWCQWAPSTSSFSEVSDCLKQIRGERIWLAYFFQCLMLPVCPVQMLGQKINFTHNSSNSLFPSPCLVSSTILWTYLFAQKTFFDVHLCQEVDQCGSQELTDVAKGCLCHTGCTLCRHRLFQTHGHMDSWTAWNICGNLEWSQTILFMVLIFKLQFAQYSYRHWLSGVHAIFQLCSGLHFANCARGTPFLCLVF